MFERCRRPAKGEKRTVRVVIVNERNEVLLLQKSGTSNASNLREVPGGGIEKKDRSIFRARTIKNAAIREVEEETGITLKRKQLRVIGGFDYRFQGKNDIGSQERKVEVLFVKIKGTINVTVTEEEGNKHVDAAWVSRDIFDALGRSVELSGNTKPISTMLDFAGV